MKRYSFIIVGAGASGLSLACQLANEPRLRDRSILLVERSLRRPPNRTWAFWEKAGAPMPFSEVAFHSWRRLLVATPGRTLALRTKPYIYKAIDSSDFFRCAHARLSAFSNIELLEGEVDSLEDSDEGATVCVGGEQYQGDWVFDSRFELAGFNPGSRAHYLKMQIRGWEIETELPAFDPRTATFLDFRTPQTGGGARFLYVLPSHEQRALVEQVACIPATRALMSLEEEEQALKRYIEGPLQAGRFRVLKEEEGVNPMTDYSFPRRKSRHVMAIGIAGGRLKPSSGFAFARIQRDSMAIVQSLRENGHPFDVPRTELIYRLCEPPLLWMMSRHGEKAGAVFGGLFRVGRTHKILSFLDEKGLPI